MTIQSRTTRSLTLSHITYTYPRALSPTLEDLSASFPVGWSGIVGDNGCGKSTLARIACRLIAPDRGSVTGPSLCLYCEQDPQVPPADLEDFACDWSREATRLRGALGIEDDMPWRFSELSCGEQKKLQVAVALWRQPDVLVLDEPTNHVDARTRSELIEACRNFPGIGLLISHDREMLDALCGRCLRFEGGAASGAWRPVMRPGGYSQGNDQAQIEAEGAIRAKERARAELTRLRREQQRRSQEAAAASSMRSKRNIDVKDKDAKVRIDLAIYTGKDGQAGRLASRMDARVARKADELDAMRVEKRYDGSLWINASPHPRKTLIHIEQAVIPLGAEGRTLSIPELFIGNRDHIGIEGPNGAGKSTLLRHVAPLIPADIDALVIPQELERKERSAFMARLRALDRSECGQVLSLVAQLNSDPKRIMRSCIQGDAEPSPGELRKLMLAEGALRGCPLIVMDEPSNHLDLHSVEALGHCLAEFPGALLLVSHDARFLEECTDKTLHVEDGAVTVLH